jgi:hypothetical protein
LIKLRKRVKKVRKYFFKYYSKLYCKKSKPYSIIIATKMPLAPVNTLGRERDAH